MKKGDTCVIFPTNEKGFRPYQTIIKNIKNNIIEIGKGDNLHFKAGKNIIIELSYNSTLKRYKGTVRKTGKTTMLCVVSENSEKDRKYSRVSLMSGMTFRLWTESKKQYKGLCTNISGNGMIFSTEAISYPGEIVLIDKIKLENNYEIIDKIMGRVVKFKAKKNNDEEYNQIIINFLYISDVDRNNIINFVNKKQKKLKEKGIDNEIDDLSFLEEFM